MSNIRPEHYKNCSLECWDAEKVKNHGINVPRVIEVQHDYLEQKKIPSKQAEFLTKRMNLPARRGDGMR